MDNEIDMSFHLIFEFDCDYKTNIFIVSMSYCGTKRIL